MGEEQSVDGQGWSWKTGSPEKRRRVARFIEWCVTPEALRDPASKQGLADELGVHINTLRNYQRDPGFAKAVTDLTRARARFDRLPAVLDSLYEQARNPDNPRSVSASRLLIDFAMQEDKEEGGLDASKMGQEELVKMALELLHKAQGEPTTV